MFASPLAGGRLLLNTQLPAIQALVHEADQAVVTTQVAGTFIKTLGSDFCEHMWTG